jgi:hypothetical protein
MSLSFLFDIDQYDSVTKPQLAHVVAISHVAHSHLRLHPIKMTKIIVPNSSLSHSLGERDEASVYGQ